MEAHATARPETSRPAHGMRFVTSAADYLDSRTGISGLVAEVGRKIFPDHWSFMLGEVALYSFVTILISGTFLTFFFQPSMAEVVYHGAWVPLKGIQMSAALNSVLHISFDIRGGLLMRQVHHWAALLFIAAIGLHMLRIFFTGAFRKPREINWAIGFSLFILALAEGFTGYSLPDDLLSGNGLRIIYGMVEAIPVIGVWIGYLLFGGQFPGTDIVSRFYSLHIMLLPAALIALLGMHLLFVIINKHTQWAGPGKSNDNVVGVPIMPVFAAKAGGFFFIVFGVIVLIASFFTINPIWLYGPYDPSPISAGTQPDWYIGFADGALRLIPPHLEVVWFGYTVSFNILIPIVALLALLASVAAYPFVEAWITGDKREHHIAQRPRNAPTRTGIGAFLITFYAALWAAASSDIIATHFKMSVEQVIHLMQFLAIAGPFIAFFVTKRVCLNLQKKDREIVLHGYESGRIVRLPGGQYVEVHKQATKYEMWRLVDYDSYQPLIPRPDADGRLPARERLQASLSGFFFQDLIRPVTPAEVAHTGLDSEATTVDSAARADLPAPLQTIGSQNDH